MTSMRSRLAKLFNWFLVAVQVVAICILISLGFSRDYYVELFSNIDDGSKNPLGSPLLNLVMSDGAAYAWTLVLGLVLAKEFFLKSFTFRLKLNLVLLLALLITLGFILPAIYSPL